MEGCGGCGDFVGERACSNRSVKTSTHCSSNISLTSASMDLEIALLRASLFTLPLIAWIARWGGTPLCLTCHTIKKWNGRKGHRREFFRENIAYRHDKKTKKTARKGRSNNNQPHHVQGCCNIPIAHGGSCLPCLCGWHGVGAIGWQYRTSLATRSTFALGRCSRTKKWRVDMQQEADLKYYPWSHKLID